MVWQVVWPFLAYEGISQILYFLTAPLIGAMGTMLAAALLTAGVLYPCYRNRLLRQRRRAGYSWTLRMDFAGAAPLILGLAISSGILVNMLVAMSGLSRYSEAYQEVGEALFGVSVWLQVLVMAVAAPLVEELIFRGLAYERLRKEMGVLPAAVLSALLFGLSHGNLMQGVYGFLLGILLALVYEHFQGLASSMLFHAGANLASILLNLFLAAFPSVAGFIGFPLILLAVSGAVFVFSLRRMYDRRARSVHS